MTSKLKLDLPPHFQVMAAVFEAADTCRRENDALRKILRTLGHSEKSIQSKLKSLLKGCEQDESGAQLVKRACKEAIKQMRDHDAQEVLAGLDPIGGIQ